MLTVLIFPFLALLPKYQNVEDLTQDIAGTYQLQGVMETAAMFSFHSDSTFEFYFSYGAVDRYATGTYSQKDSSVILKGNKIPGKDFAISKSTKQGSGITLQVNNPNEILRADIICVFYKGGNSELRYTDKKGKCNFTEKPDSIQLVHPMYPDEATVFFSASFPENLNYHELTLEPSLEQLSFLNMPLYIKGNTFSCQLSWLAGEKVLNFYKSEPD